jgi:hypothetical protein
MPYALDPFRGMFHHVRVDVFPPSVQRRAGVVYTCLPGPHQLNVHRLFLGALRRP